MIRSFIATALLFVCSIAAAEEPAPALVARYDHLTLGAPVSVSDLSLSSGQLKLKLASGTAAPVKAGDETVGIFFHGQGTFTYTADAVEAPIVKTNLRTTKTKAAFDGTNISGGFTILLLVTAGGPPPTLTGAPSPDKLDAAFAAERAEFLQNQDTQLAYRMAEAKLVAGGRVTQIEMSGNDDEWVHVFDGGVDHYESLATLFFINFDDHARRVERYEAPIAYRPLGRSRLDAPPVPFTLTAVDYTVVASDGRDVAVTIKETLVPRMAGARGLWLELPEKLYRDGNKPPRHYRVKSITAADGTKLEFSHRLKDLLITLPAPTAAGRPFDLTFELAGDILTRPSGDNYWILRDEWLPHPQLAAIATTAHGVVKVKAPFTPFAGGKTIKRGAEGDYNVVETLQDQPRNDVYITAGKYLYDEQKKGNLTIRTGSYGIRNDRAIKRITALAFDMVNYYEYFLGPFPAEELNILELNDFGLGQSPAGFVFITSEAFQPILGEVNQLYSEGINERLAHELAHQYWGNSVRWSGAEEEWLSESFAEYSAALLLKKFQGDAPYKRLVAHWRGDANAVKQTSVIPFANRVVDLGGYNDTRRALLYGKGPYLLAALHKEVGDETFLTFLKSYQKNFRGKIGSTKDVIGLLGFLAKKDYKPFFEQYYWGTEVPNL